MIKLNLTRPSMVLFLMCTLWMNLLHADHRDFPAGPGKTNCDPTPHENWLPLSSDSLNCYAATSENVPLAISNPDAGVVSSILKVELSGLITDVNLSGLSIPHTRVGNLTVTLTSPEGTTITLLDRPGGGACLGDNLLVSFDDAAASTAAELQATCNPAVPAISGDFQPLEALSAFEGENPLGDWILTVSDQVPGAGGALVSWGLEICAAPCSLTIDSIAITATGQCGDEQGNISIFTSPAFNYPVIYTIYGPVQQSNETGIFTDVPVGTYHIEVNVQGLINCSADTTILLGIGNYPTDLPAEILSTRFDTVTSILHVPNPRLISSVKVSRLDISHTYVGDLEITLTSPSGTIVRLKNRQYNMNFGCSGNDILVSFDDDAALTAFDLGHTCNIDTTAILGTFQPIDPFSVFTGENMMGDWILTVYDLALSDGGFINDWYLEICSLPCDVVLTDITVQNEICPGAADGSIAISAHAAVLPVTYAISGPVNQSNETGLFENLPTGDYEISITSNDTTCTVIDSAVIVSMPPTSFPAGWSNYNIGNAGGSAIYDICAPNSEFVLTSKGAASTFDLQHSLLRSLCGDGSIIAQVTSIENAGWAGIEIRDNTTTSSRKVALKTQLGARVRRVVRTMPGVPPQSQEFATQPGPIWLQIQRVGNSFKLFVSADGADWQQIGNTVTLTLSACVQLGLFVEGFNANTTTTATFDQVSTTGNAVLPLARPDAPVLSVANPMPELQLYPNPTTGEVTIDLNAYANRTVQVLLYDAQGSLLNQIEVDVEPAFTQRLDFSSHENGVYLVRVKSDGLPDLVKQVVVQGKE